MSLSVGNRTSRSLIYGLNLLTLFTADEPVRGIKELAELMDVSAPTAHRYAATCLELGYLEQAPMRRYRLARRSAEPGIAMLDSLSIIQPARPLLRALRAETGRTVSQAVLDGTDVLYLQRLCGFERGQYRLEKGLGPGSRRTARQTAAGEALLTALGDPSDSAARAIGRERVTVDEGGLRRGACGIAVTVRCPGEKTCAVEITLPLDAMSAAELAEQLYDPLLGAAAALQSALAQTGSDLCVAG
jgi:DNA-binding IclR family transcriptional regulator